MMKSLVYLTVHMKLPVIAVSDRDAGTGGIVEEATYTVPSGVAGNIPTPASISKLKNGYHLTLQP